MSPTETEVTDTLPPFRLLEIAFRGSRTSGTAFVIQAPDVPEAAREKIHRELGTLGGSFNAEHHLRSLPEHVGQTGFAVVVRPENTALAIPRPLDTQIEPIALDEGHRDLKALCEHPAIADAIPVEKRAGRRHRRWMARLGFSGLLLFLLIQGISQIAVHRSWLVGVGWGSILVVAAGYALVSWWRADDWYLVPGGVAIRRGLFKKEGRLLQLCTRSNAWLMLRWVSPNWRATLYVADARWHRTLTELECVALLAAWQSPLPPPEVERLSDLA